MNKAELIKEMAKKADLSKAGAEKALDAFMECIAEALADGEKVSLIGFGSFEAKPRAEREGRNPQTGETVRIPACIAPTFKAGKGLKDKVQG